MTFPIHPDLDPVAPECRSTIDRLQVVLDGAAAPDSLADDPHPAICSTCRERLRAGLALMSALNGALRTVPVTLNFTASILAGIRTDRRSRFRQRLFACSAGAATAAAVVVAVWFSPSGHSELPHPVANDATVNLAPSPAPLPAAQPVLRIDSELARAGDAFRDSSRPLAGRAAAAPTILAAFTDSLIGVSAPARAPAMESVHLPLADLPEVARVGLEPVTGTAQKAFSRLLKDVAAMQPMKLKS